MNMGFPPTLAPVEGEFVRFQAQASPNCLITITNKRIHFSERGGSSHIPLRLVTSAKAENGLFFRKQLLIGRRGEQDDFLVSCQSNQQANELARAILDAIAGL